MERLRDSKRQRAKFKYYLSRGMTTWIDRTPLIFESTLFFSNSVETGGHFHSRDRFDSSDSNGRKKIPIHPPISYSTLYFRQLESMRACYLFSNLFLRSRTVIDMGYIFEDTPTLFL